MGLRGCFLCGKYCFEDESGIIISEAGLETSDNDGDFDRCCCTPLLSLGVPLLEGEALGGCMAETTSV